MGLGEPVFESWQCWCCCVRLGWRLQQGRKNGLLAAAVGAAKYWACTGRAVGELGLAKEAGCLRVLGTNLRRVKRDGEDHKGVVWNETMTAVRDLDVVVWCGSDTRLGDDGSPGRAALWSAGSTKESVSKLWGGEGMNWTHQQGCVRLCG